MNNSERINEIRNLNSEECWYITKQNLDFKTLVIASHIASEYNETLGINYQAFFEQKANEFGITPNHRMTNNCYYLGLLEKKSTQYKDAISTDILFEIKQRCNNDFNKIELYNDILINQIEKVHITNDIDEKKDSLRKDFKIFPAFFLYKVLLIIGDTTGEYKITLDEFKLFLGTAKNYKNYFHTTVSLILESRNNIEFLNQFNTVKPNFNDNRFNKLFENLPFLKDGLEIKNEFIDLVRQKVCSYERAISSYEFTIDFLKKSKYDNTIQKIYYGAPGTGKSYKVNEIVDKLPQENVERVTFHPEYDYNSFVGGYKPTMDGNDIKYEFVPQIFTKIYVDAWNSIANGTQDSFYLVLEEINRGNCAEIFGDIFQLLDRNSKYDITPSKDLKEYLEKVLNNTVFGLENGKLLLPNNLSILATMNTSDQSLFPMDSAFKRRWDWEYIPINYSQDNNPSSEFKVELGNKTFSWLQFIEKVNKEWIKPNENLGIDKCLGNYFINPKSNTIDLETFINKAIFYLWNDVFKDESEDLSIFKKNTNYEDFFPIDEYGIKKIQELLELLEIQPE